MADESKILLTPEEQGAIYRKIMDLWQGSAKNCPICGSNHWLVGAHVVQPITITRERTVQFGGTSYPQVMLISAPCGYTMFFNAVVLDVLPPKTAAPPGKPDG